MQEQEKESDFFKIKEIRRTIWFFKQWTFYLWVCEKFLCSIADGNSQKNVWLKFPNRIDSDDKEKIESWGKKEYAKNITFFEEDVFDVKLDFMEYIRPFKIEKIKEVIEDITDYIAHKYPEEKIVCSGDNCSSTSEIGIYDVSGVPIPMCGSCALRLEHQLENTYEEEKLKPNNYVRGSIAAIVFPIPGIFLTFFFFLMGKIAAASGVVYYFLAQKGYVWAKGKFNKIGVLIVSLISLLYTVVGTYLSYIAVLVKEILKEPSLKGIALGDAIKFAFNVTKEPKVKKEMLTNIYLALFLCGIAIVFYTIQSFSRTKKDKIKKA